MTKAKDFFFCGVGGSGMLPLAMIVKAAGHRVAGSDRALDQGRTTAKFDYLRSIGVDLYQQDGSGVARPDQIVVASAAVEETVPDIVAAIEVGAKRMSRADLLALLFNGAQKSIGVAGTSGKSTTTAMVGWILHHAGVAPTIINGAVMKNFMSADALFASAVVGDGEAFVAEVDESDGSIAMYNPSIAVVNNIALDHKSMDELRTLFGAFVERADMAILNLDNDETAKIAKVQTKKNFLTYSLNNDAANFVADKISPEPFGVSFDVVSNISNETAMIALKMPGRHNVSNALAAIAAANVCGVSLENSAAALNEFLGVKRRLEFVGEASGVTLFDDFAHNPDKISASLTTLHEFPGRLLVMFQPHGFGPLKKMRNEFIETFSNHLGEKDILMMPEPVYFGGTVDKSVGSKDIAGGLRRVGRQAETFETRDECGERLLELAQAGDRIVIMGARDDTLSEFAQSLLKRLSD
ncbi:MAG: UDP-N-acetylmuramate--alanine ligase [Marinicaulis sp.]|nr:UDP-N-acetylmuramate--alanine ligase [Marinicaulis sp.]